MTAQSRSSGRLCTATTAATADAAQCVPSSHHVLIDSLLQMLLRRKLCALPTVRMRKPIRHHSKCNYLKKYVPEVELLRAELSILTGPVLLLLVVSRLLLAIACAIAVSSSSPPWHKHEHDQ
eukprot:11722-Heterococcus_DN1.PRE.3